MTLRRRLLCTAVPALLVAVLAGCGTMATLKADVSSYGEWPAGRAPGRYAFERLPSQQAQAERAESLEKAATAALRRAGFVPVAQGQDPDVLVQLGARFTRTTLSPWEDPLWWPGGFGRWHRGPWAGPLWGVSTRWTVARYDHEVAVLLRDRASGKPLYETRAATDSGARADADTVAALFAAALADFPQPALSPRRVTVPLGAAAAAAASAPAGR